MSEQGFLIGAVALLTAMGAGAFLYLTIALPKIRSRRRQRRTHHKIDLFEPRD